MLYYIREKLTPFTSVQIFREYTVTIYECKIILCQVKTILKFMGQVYISKNVE